jgi:hypothetical protein
MKVIPLASLLLGTLAPAWASADDARPNISFILADDQGMGEVSSYGSDREALELSSCQPQ